MIPRLEPAVGGRIYPCDGWSISRAEWLGRASAETTGAGRFAVL